MSQAKEKVEEYERRLREEGMSSSGVGSIHSDQDSGKHSDNSLVISRYCVHILYRESEMCVVICKRECRPE